MSLYRANSKYMSVLSTRVIGFATKFHYLCEHTTFLYKSTLAVRIRCNPYRKGNNIYALCKFFYDFCALFIMKSTEHAPKPKNLDFFKEFLEKAGVKYEALAEKLGLTTTGIHYWFRCDDVRLSYVFDAADALGYNLYISISDTPSKFGDLEKAGRNAALQPEVKRLYFLSCALKEERVTKQDLAEKLGITRDAISYWYSKDDVTVKNLIACAKVLGRNLNFSFVKKDDETKYAREDILLRSNIYTSTTRIIGK